MIVGVILFLLLRFTAEGGDTMTKHLYFYASFEDAARLNRELIQLGYRNYYLEPHEHLVAFVFEPVTEVSHAILKHLFDADDLSHLEN